VGVRARGIAIFGTDRDEVALEPINGVAGKQEERIYRFDIPRSGPDDDVELTCDNPLVKILATKRVGDVVEVVVWTCPRAAVKSQFTITARTPSQVVTGRGALNFGGPLIRLLPPPPVLTSPIPPLKTFPLLAPTALPSLRPEASLPSLPSLPSAPPMRGGIPVSASCGISPALFLQTRPLTMEKEVVDLGIIRGKACEKSISVVSVAFPIEYRFGLTGQISDEYNCLSIDAIRGNGPRADVMVLMDSRRSGDKPFHMRLEGLRGRVVEGEGRMIIERPEPFILGMQTICGGSVSSACPILSEFPVAKRYVAFFEPKMKEYWLSQNKGVIEAGAKEFPFKVFFAPKDPRPTHTLLVVEMDDLEICVKVCGSIGGFEGRRWGERRHI
jgi:hypothetical protein